MDFEEHEASHKHERVESIQKTHDEEQNSLKIAIVVTAVIMFIEVLGGFRSRSLSLFSDAWHMFTDTSALTLCFIAGKMALKPPTSDKTFGFYRVEVLSAFVNGLTLVGAASFIFYEASRRLLYPTEVEGFEMLIFTIVGLVGNLISITVLEKGMLGLNVKSAFLHVLSDTLSSVGVMIAAIIIFFTGWNFVDPVMSLLVGLIIMYSTGKMLREVVHILLEGVPRNVSLDEAEMVIKSVPEIIEVHDLHIWSITSYMQSLTAHLVISKDEMNRAGLFLDKVKKRIEKKFGIRHTTFQVEPENYEETGVVHRN